MEQIFEFGKYIKFLYEKSDFALMINQSIWLFFYFRQMDNNQIKCITDSAIRNLHDMEIL